MLLEMKGYHTINVLAKTIEKVAVITISKNNVHIY